MKKQTQLAIRKILDSEWFSSVGKPVGRDVAVATNWDDAIKSCSSLKWQNTCLEAENLLREAIDERSPQRMEQWNDLVDEIEEAIHQSVHDKLRQCFGERELPERVDTRVRLDIVGYCVELEYADIVQPSFYNVLGQWYIDGHFPCGWKGKYPRGMLVVY